MTRDSVYCIDTSSLILARMQRYPYPAFRTLRENVEDLVRQERLIAPEDVFRELRHHEDEVTVWATAHRHMFVPFEPRMADGLNRLAAAFPQLSSSIRAKGAASDTDQLVVCLAHARGCLLVSEEGTGSPNKPKVPELCEHLGVIRIRFLDIVLREGWTF